MTTTPATPKYEPASRPTKLTREGFGEAIREAARRNPRVVVVTADAGRVTYFEEFAREFPDRAYDVGIAEQNLIGIAAGMASAGLIPIATSYAPFVTVRSLEQIRLDCAYTGFNVKIAGVYGGISLATGGSTHHATEDLAMLRSLAKMAVIAPADAVETYKATLAMVEYAGPVYIRLGGRYAEPIVYQEDYEFAIGKAVTLREGRDLTIIATGSMVVAAVQAAEALALQGVQARVLDMHTIKPLDKEAIVKAAHETGRILTAEEHSTLGGLGGAVAEVVVQSCPVPMKLLGIPDLFLTVGPVAQLQGVYGLNWEGVVGAASDLLKAN